jgi:hypothetical protein
LLNGKEKLIEGLPSVGGAAQPKGQRWRPQKGSATPKHQLRQQVQLLQQHQQPHHLHLPSLPHPLHLSPPQLKALHLPPKAAPTCLLSVITFLVFRHWDLAKMRLTVVSVSHSQLAAASLLQEWKISMLLVIHMSNAFAYSVSCVISWGLMHSLFCILGTCNPYFRYIQHVLLKPQDCIKSVLTIRSWPMSSMILVLKVWLRFP